MKKFYSLVSLLICITTFGFSQSVSIVRPTDANIQITGRRYVADINTVEFAFPGVSIKATFQGTSISAILKEYGSGSATTTNYFNVIIDGGTPTVLQLKSSQTVYELAKGLSNGEHTIELFKRTESSVGKVAFKGFILDAGKKIVQSQALPKRKIEFIGNSITCGYGNEISTNSPDSYHFKSVNENNYNAWGAITARNLNAQYSCVAYSGRGLMQNNTGSKVGTLPKIYDQVFADNANYTWNHYDYIPDVVVINLGSNDFAAEVSSSIYKVDSAAFVQEYIAFITKLRSYYPNASFICAVGTMMSDGYPAGGKHWTRIQAYVSSVSEYFKSQGDNKVFYLKLTPQSGPYGEDWHPTVATQTKMATAITNFINTNIAWDTCGTSVNLGKDINVKYSELPVKISSNSEEKENVKYTWYKNGELLLEDTTELVFADTVGIVGKYVVVRDSAGCKSHDDIVISNAIEKINGVCKWQDNKQAAVVLTFDDWSAGHPAIAVPELKKRNLVATFNVMNTVSNWTKVEEAALYGNEIANHTKTHPDLTKLSNEAIGKEIRFQDSLINNKITNQKVSTFAYPFGTFNQAIIDTLIAYKYYGARGVWGMSNYAYNFAPTINDYFNLRAYGLTTTTSITSYAAELTKVINGGGFLTYLYHSVNSPTVVDNNYAAVPETEFLHQLDTIVSLQKKLWVTTYTKAIAYHRQANCATLTQVEAPKNGTWKLNLTDTLSDNAMFNKPLSIVLPMNNVPYDMVTQNGVIIPVDSIFNDTIMFKAVPDNGEIIVGISGIESTIQTTPTVLYNSEDTEIECVVTATSLSGIKKISADFSSVGGSADSVLALQTGDTYSCKYTIAKTNSFGYKRIPITITDNANSTKIENTGVLLENGIQVKSFTVTQTADSICLSLVVTDNQQVVSVKSDLTSLSQAKDVALLKMLADTFYVSIPRGTITAGSKSISFTILDNSNNSIVVHKKLTIETVSSAKELDEELHVYPNPTKGKVYVKSKQSSIISVSVINQEGRLCEKIKPSSAEVSIELPKDNGTYILVIETGNGTIEKKVLVE